MVVSLLTVLFNGCLFLSVSSSSSNIVPGQAVLWGTSNLGSTGVKPDYITTAETRSTSLQKIDQRSKDAEVVVVLSSGPNSKTSCLKHPAVMESVKSANHATVFSNIYSDSSPSITSSSDKNIAATSSSESAKSSSTSTMSSFSTIVNELKSDYPTMSLQELKTTLSNSESAILSNKKRDIFHVNMEGVDQQSLNDIASLGLSVFFLAFDEPGLEAVAPSSAASYERVLATSRRSSWNTDGIYYKPEGAEYSIYYADTYLYITPDIFTGAMTGLFFLFTGELHQ